MCAADANKNVITIADWDEYMDTKQSTAIASVIVSAGYSSYHGCTASVVPRTGVTDPVDVDPIVHQAPHKTGTKQGKKNNTSVKGKRNMNNKKKSSTKHNRKMAGKKGKKSQSRKNNNRRRHTKATIKASGKTFKKHGASGAVGGVSFSKTVPRH